jgi:hypothetical protein
MAWPLAHLAPEIPAVAKTAAAAHRAVHLA